MELIIAVDDFDSSSDNDMVDLIYLTIPVTVSLFDTFSPMETVPGYYNYSFVSFSYRMKCADGFHGSTCSDKTVVTPTPSPSQQLPGAACTDNPSPALVSSLAAACDVQASQLMSILCMNATKCTATSNTHPPITNEGDDLQISASSWELVIFMVISAVLFGGAVVCSVLVILMIRKNRRAAIPARNQRRQLPTPPPSQRQWQRPAAGHISVSADDQNDDLELHNCPAYERRENNDLMIVDEVSSNCSDEPLLADPGYEQIQAARQQISNCG